MDLSPGEAFSLRQQGENGEARLAYGRGRPRCHACKTDFDPDLLREADFDCAECGVRIRCRPSDELVRGLLPGAVQVIGESFEEPMPQARAPVMFQCLGCGAGLGVDGSSRMVDCAHCGSTSYLPDGLWRVLNPVEKVRIFFVLAELGPEAIAELKALSDED